MQRSEHGGLSGVKRASRQKPASSEFDRIIHETKKRERTEMQDEAQAKREAAQTKF